MRTCPNRHCRLIHEDSVGQCPNCGASMSRRPDADVDVNAHLYSMRMNAGQTAALGVEGGMRPGAEPTYRETADVAAVAAQVLEELM